MFSSTRIHIVLLTICLILCGGAHVSAQFYHGLQTDFGKNRVQYEDFIWKTQTDEMCDIYFYPASEQTAFYVRQEAPDIIAEIGYRMNLAMDRKLLYFIFARKADYEQSNFGYDDRNQYNTAGNFTINDTRIMLYFTGDMLSFREQLYFSTAKVMITEALYGTNLAKNLLNSGRTEIPDWFIDGLCAYYTYGWSIDLDDRMHIAMQYKKFSKYYNLNSEDKQLLGHSFWEFIYEQYGENAIQSIVYSTIGTHSMDKSVRQNLGMPLSQLIEEWKRHYAIRYNQFSAKDDYITLHHKRETAYGQVQPCPDGIHLAYITNYHGRYGIYLYNTQTRKQKNILRRNPAIEEYSLTTYPVLAWHPSGNTLAFITEYKNDLFLYEYDMTEAKVEKVQVIELLQVNDMQYSPDGRYIALSGVKDGQSDIYIYNVGSRALEQITNDVFDDFSPTFGTDSKTIFFVSTRTKPAVTTAYNANSTAGTIHHDTTSARTYMFVYDSEEVTDTVSLPETEVLNCLQQEQTHSTDIFSTSVVAGRRKIKRMTYTPGIEISHPIVVDQNHLLFLCDYNRQQRLWSAETDSVIRNIDTTVHYTHRVSLAPADIYQSERQPVDISYDRKNQTLAYTYRGKLHEDIKLQQLHYSHSPTTLLPERAEWKQKQIDAKAVQLAYQQHQQHLSEDTVQDAGNVKSIQQVMQSEIGLAPATVANINQHRIVHYKPHFILNNVIGQFDSRTLEEFYQIYSPVGQPIYNNADITLFASVGTVDLLENKRLTAGVRMQYNIDNMQYLFCYEDLSKRIDRQVAFFHKNTVQSNYAYSRKNKSDELYYCLKYPFNRVAALRATVPVRYEYSVYEGYDDRSLAMPKEEHLWTGTKIEYIYDATRSLGTNFYAGQRMKVFFEYNQSIGSNSKTLFVAGVDARHYLPIRNTLIWANRFGASTSFGKSKLCYYMGGSDGWLAPKFNKSVSVDESQGYAYQTLATHMRGFNQNIRNGNSFFILNSELRFAIYKHFAKKQAANSFIENLQLVSFVDIGTAWTGLSPYSDDNHFFLHTVTQGNLSVTLRKQIEPVVGGFGLGVRTSLLGYFIRFDVAWGVEEKTVHRAIPYLSLGLDF